MRNPMNRRLPRELKADFGKYLVIFLFLVMVVSVVSGFLVANAGIADAYKRNMRENKLEDGHLSFNVRPDEELLSNIAKHAAVTLYRADFFEESDTDGTTFRVYRYNEDVNVPEVTDGRLPQAPGEIAVDNLHAHKEDIKVGDHLTVGGRDLTVVGLLALPNYSALFKDNADLMFEVENFGVGLMSAEGFDAYDSDHVTVGYAWRYKEKPETDKAKQEAAEVVLTALRDELVATNTEIIQRALAGETGLTMLEVSDFLPEYENKSIQFAGEDMNGDQGAMEVFLYIVIAVLAFIVAVTTINALSKEAGVIGTLRASGYTRGEMVRHYMILPLCAFFAGMLAGNVLG